VGTISDGTSGQKAKRLIVNIENIVATVSLEQTLDLYA